MEEVDKILREILSDEQRTKEIDAMLDCDDKFEIDSSDLAFIKKMLDSCRKGSQAVFIALHPNDRMQYMVIGIEDEDYLRGGIALVAMALSQLIIRTNKGQ